jgi:hypothetical protein
MLTALRPHARRADEQAFKDRLPYVLDLLAGVGRQIDEAMPGAGPVATWWETQRTQDREAIRQMRNAELKRLESGTKREVDVQTNAPAGTFHGKTVNAGDTLVEWGWYFASGHFVGQEVLTVLSAQLTDRQFLINDAESRLS